ncbi:MAG: YbaB/EbfC family nucleoid-associated protein [Bacteroidota bacterium]
MFGDMMGQMEEMQAKMKEKLHAISVTAEAGDGLVKVTANGAREITNINISSEVMDDAEALEDLLLVALNRALEAAAEKEAAEGQSLISGMLPGGLGNMFGQ